jgi:hypothetical protein
MDNNASTASAALPEGESSPAGTPLPLPVRHEEIPRMLVVLAGIGGALLGDKVGLWIKKTRTSGNG